MTALFFFTTKSIKIYTKIHEGFVGCFGFFTTKDTKVFTKIYEGFGGEFGFLPQSVVQN